MKLHFAQHVHREFVAAVDLGVSLLPAEPEHVYHREAEHLDLVECLLHGVELLRFDDGENEFHDIT